MVNTVEIFSIVLEMRLMNTVEIFSIVLEIRLMNAVEIFSIVLEMRLRSLTSKSSSRLDCTNRSPISFLIKCRIDFWGLTQMVQDGTAILSPAHTIIN